MSHAVDWKLAQRVAIRVANRGYQPDVGSPAVRSIGRDFAELTAQAEGLVGDATGLRSAGPARARVVDRASWIRANIASFQRLLRPLTDRMAERTEESGPLAEVTRLAAGAEVGAVLGWMSTRVLGQYDLLIIEDGKAPGATSTAAPTATGNGATSAADSRHAGSNGAASAAGADGFNAAAGAGNGNSEGTAAEGATPTGNGNGADEGDMVYYVGPNIATLERRHGFPTREFRLWLALHETTHRAQFTGIPWLRPHFLSLVDEALDVVDPDPGRLIEAARRIRAARAAGEDPFKRGGLTALLAPPEQQGVLDKLSGMMSLLEGHGDVTMDRAGAARIPESARFGRVLRARRASARGVAKLLQRLAGIEAKLYQYQAGEEFIEAVEQSQGPAFVDRAWAGPECLPSMDEIRSPESWIDRMNAAPAA